MPRSNVIAHYGSARPLELDDLCDLIGAQAAVAPGAVSDAINDVRQEIALGRVDREAVSEALSKLLDRQTKAVIETASTGPADSRKTVAGRRSSSRRRAAAASFVAMQAPRHEETAALSAGAPLWWRPQGAAERARQGRAESSGASPSHHAARSCDDAGAGAPVRRAPRRGRSDDQVNKLLAESWNEKMWADGEPIDPSPTIDQAVSLRLQRAKEIGAIA